MQATTAPAVPAFPVRLQGHLEQPSRALWIVKWLLLIPHFFCLAFLWLAFVLLSFVSFLALLFGGRYPQGIFGFNLGVLRWSWRVAFYAFAANGTDRYPPFTLDDVPDYPARLEIDYPASQRHGLPLIGWWLAGIPQYLVAGIFAGAGMLTWQVGTSSSWSIGIGLVDLLVLFAVIALLVRGVYPRSIFDLVLGLNRWVLRVGAYAALMTREYPPFRIDTGEVEPGQIALFPNPATAAEPAAGAPAERWGAGRVIALVVGTVVTLIALALLAAGTTAVVYDQTQRDATGYLTTGPSTYATKTHAFVSDSYRTGTDGIPRGLIGTVRITSVGARPVFLGIGPAHAVESYLAGVSREVGSAPGRPGDFRTRGVGSPETAPTAQSFWAATAVGSRTQNLTWKPESGRWRIVLMNADGSAGVLAQVSAGATVPHLLSIAVGILVTGAFVLLVGAGIVVAAVRRRAPAAVTG
jgi:hypothetical protein